MGQPGELGASAPESGELGDVANLGPPILLAGVNVEGVSAQTGLAGQPCNIWRRYAATSDQFQFHGIADGMLELLESHLRAAGAKANLRGASWILAVIKPDQSAELYVDAAAIVQVVRLKRSAAAGQALFQHDISDVMAVKFPAVEIAAQDQVLIVFRVGWRFALYFDFTRELDAGEMETTLGKLYRTLAYHDAFAALSNPEVFDRLVGSGWFPFIDIQGREFTNLFGALTDPDDLPRAEAALLQAFTDVRINEMFARWMHRPMFRKREEVLRPGVDAFLAQQPVLAIKTLVTEIEGVIQDAHIVAANTNAKTRGLIEFAAKQAQQKAGAPDSLFFPSEFQRYLSENTYRAFDPMTADQPATRHAVGHGAAPSDAYTMTRALQTILTLDQLSFYL